MCIASWAINFALLFMFWLIRRRYDHFSFWRSFKNDLNAVLNSKALISAVSFFGVFLIILVLFFPKYWDFSLGTQDHQIRTGVTGEGYPWIGAEQPELTIYEFSDYRCFQCRKMHFFLRNLVAGYPGKLRLVHRNFPMDHEYNPLVKKPFHKGSGMFAMIAIAAAQLDRFWETNDYLYRYDLGQGAIYLSAIAKDLGFDLEVMKKHVFSKKTKQKLQNDIIYGIKNGFEGTPAYMIEGKLYTGQIPSDILKRLEHER